MKFICASLMLLGLCSVVAGQSRPVKQDSVSVNLTEFGEGAERKIRLTLSGPWASLPESTRQHVLEKLRAMLPEEGLKASLLALTKGETEIDLPVGARPKEPTHARHSIPMIKLTPGVKIVPQAGQSKTVVIPGGTETREFEELPAELREKLEAAIKARHEAGRVHMRLGQPGEQIFRLKVRDEDQAPGAPHAGAEHRTRVMVASNQGWHQLPEDARRQLLESLRESLPPEMMKDVLEGLARDHHRDMAAFREGCRSQPGPRRHGRQPGPDQALVRALTALTHEVRALRREVASLRGEHPMASAVPVRVITSKDGRLMVGAVPKAPQMDKLPALENEVKHLRSEMEEMRSALETLMRELHRLQPK